MTPSAQQHERFKARLGSWSLLILVALAGCKTDLNPPARTNSHLTPPEAKTQTEKNIPSIVSPVPLVPAPTSDKNQELYTGVAQDIPIRDFLFILARESALNVDVDPNVSGNITINAIDQSLPQIMERISHQANIRWNFDEAGNLVVKPDDPYWATYNVNYVNVQRTSTTTTKVATSIASGTSGGGGAAAGGANNSSTSSLTQTSNNNFWATLTSNLSTLLGDAAGGGTGTAAKISNNVVANPEGGVVSVRGTARQQVEIAAFIKNIENRALYQVLIEATVVEVSLSDQYQAGVDWNTLLRNHGQISFQQNLLGSALGTSPTNVLTIDRSATPDAISATIKLLSQFGESRVLSSPKLMVLNNQVAMLRAADDKVYFTIEAQPGTPATSSQAATPAVYTSTVHTVPVGFVMTVTPQVSNEDQVTLYVRPTISRILDYALDPGPALAHADFENKIPQMHTSEIESVLKVYSGQIAILGGLMEDTMTKKNNGLPVLSRLPGIRNLFSNRNELAGKNEIVIFIRPVVVKNPSLDGDLKDYQQFLPNKSLEEQSSAISTSLVPPLSKSKSE